MTEFVIVCETRSEDLQGKGASRRLRRENLVPGVIYGAGQDPVAVTAKANEIARSLQDEAFYSHILDVTVDGKTEQAILRDLQRHPARGDVMHFDLLRVKAGEALKKKVPLHFTGEEVAPAVKTGGATVKHLMSEVEISCMPKDLPEYLEVDLSAIAEPTVIHLSDIKLPEGVEIPELALGEAHDQAIANISMKAAPQEDLDAEVAPPESDADAEGGEE